MRRYLIGLLTAAVIAALGATPAAASDPTLILLPGTKAIFSPSPASTTGIMCGSSTISLTTTSVTAWTMGSCVSNLPPITAVSSMTFNGLPYAITSVSTGSLVIHNVSLTAVLVLGDPSVICGYSAASVDATRSITGTLLTFSEQRLALTSGPLLCPAALFFSARYGPPPV